MEEYTEIARYITDAKTDSKKVIFTHGVFDLLHAGHLATLQESKAMGDILIVGVDSDPLVKALKSPKRPIITASERVELVKALKVVDQAFVITPSPEEIGDIANYFSHLYEFLKPDIVTAGLPSENGIHIMRICKQLKIDFQIAGAEVINTTTNIINKVRESF
ncbi:MAG: hypothetical protein Fur003_2360 [Candidatus Dojkabacteria bacterium]